MKQPFFSVAAFSLAAFALAAFIISLLVHIVDTIELKWAIAAGAVGLVGVGLALNSLLLALRTDSKMNEINATLSRIEDLQREIQEIQKEQKEQVDSRSAIVAPLQALSQYYMDYLTKQKSGDL